jgi:nicotinate-nucleotide adenylyltransferase
MMIWQKLGIFGGAFNPVHWGHLLVAEAALSQVGLDQVLWIPTYFPAHKKNTELLEFKHRFNMVQAAIADHSHFTAPDLQSGKEKSSYAISTLLQLKMMYGSSEWYWIIGVDSFQTLPQWRSSPQVASQCTWLVAPRNSLDATQICHQVATQLADTLHLRWQLLSMPQVEVSSSLIRFYCQNGRSLRYLVPDPVRDYIATHRFYQV